MTALGAHRFMDRFPNEQGFEPGRSSDLLRAKKVGKTAPRTERKSFRPSLPFPSLGWIEEMELDDGRVLIFREPIADRMEKKGSEYRYALDVFAPGGVGRGQTLRQARQIAAKAVWDEADRWLHTPSHTLTAAQMERKGLVLGRVDVVKSRIARRLRKSVAILGQIERDRDGSAWFRESSTEGRRFPFAPELQEKLPNDHYMRIGKRRTGEFGEPIGPIVELGEPLDAEPEQTWEEWQRIMGAND